MSSVKKAIDNFSEQPEQYKKFRPVYPEALYREILRVTPGRDRCWDCGTGNGQVAVELSQYFQQVFATDLSAKQLSQAERRENIAYLAERAEQTRFPDNYFDLITVAQAIHWFDIEKFNLEMKRVARNGATVAVWGYGLLRIDPEIDPLIDEFYTEIVGPYWDVKRRHIDERYERIDLDIMPIGIFQDLTIETNWSLAEFLGYLGTWSSVRKYVIEQKENPVTWMEEQLSRRWKKDQKRRVRFPIFMKLGTIKKQEISDKNT